MQVVLDAYVCCLFPHFLKGFFLFLFILFFFGLFKSQTFPANFLALVDTYNTLNSGRMSASEQIAVDKINKYLDEYKHIKQRIQHP